MSISSEDFQVMLGVIDQAAEKAADNVANKLRVEIQQAASDNSASIVREMKEHMSDYIGMSNVEHAIDHQTVRAIRENTTTVVSSILKETLRWTVVVFFAVAAATVTTSNEKVTPPMKINTKQSHLDPTKSESE